MVLTSNERSLLIYLWRHAGEKLSINQLARSIGITQRGAFKILQKFEQAGFVHKEKIANALIHTLNFSATEDIIKFILKNEPSRSNSEAELEKTLQPLVGQVKAAIIYGGVGSNKIYLVIGSMSVFREVEFFLAQLPQTVLPILRTEEETGIELREALHEGHVIWGYGVIHELLEKIVFPSKHPLENSLLSVATPVSTANPAQQPPSSNSSSGLPPSKKMAEVIPSAEEKTPVPSAVKKISAEKPAPEVENPLLLAVEKKDVSTKWHDEPGEDIKIAMTYLNLLENLHDFVFSLDSQGKFIYANRVVSDILGYIPTELHGKPFLDIVTEQSKTLVHNWLHVIETARSFRNLEVDLLTKDGGQVTCSLNIYPFPPKGEVQKIHVVARDITMELKLQQQKDELQEKLISQQVKRHEEGQRSKQFTDVILANIPSALVVLDSGMNFYSANSRFYTLFKKTPMQLLEGKAEDVLVGFPPATLSHLRKVLSTGLREQKEVKIGMRYFLMNILRISAFVRTQKHSPQQRQHQLMIILYDINEQKKAEKLMLQQKEQLRKIATLREVDRMKTDFLNLTSHELKTPLTPTLIQAQLLNEEGLGKLNKIQKKSTSIIIRNMRQLERLIDDVLDISRIQSGTLKLEPTKGSLDSLIREEVDSLMMKVGSRNITLTYQPVQLPVIWFDDGRIRQVLRNLLRNAIKFTLPGGTITVKAERTDGFVQVDVQDDGQGIGKKDLPRIFQPFFQVHASYQIKDKGRGLGLSICKGIIAEHGGTIWLHSKGLGKGTTFSFVLPVKGKLATNKGDLQDSSSFLERKEKEEKRVI